MELRHWRRRRRGLHRQRRLLCGSLSSLWCFEPARVIKFS